MRNLPPPPRSGSPLGMFGLLMLACVINAVHRQILSIVAPALQRDLGMSPADLELAFVALPFGAGITALPFACLLRAATRQHAAIVGVLASSAAALGTAYVHGVPSFIALRFVTGCAIALFLVAAISAGAANFPRHRAWVAGAIAFTFGVGAIVGPNLGGIVLDAYGWRAVYLVFGLAGLLSLLLMAVYVKPGFYATDDSAAPLQAIRQGLRRPAAGTIWSPRPLLLAAATVTLSISGFTYLSQYVLYLRETHAFTLRMANVAVSAYGFGALFALYGGWLGEKYGSRRVAIWAFGLIALIGGLLFASQDGPLTQHILVSALFGVAVSGLAYVNLLAGMMKLVPPAQSMQAIGLFITSFFLPVPLAIYAFDVVRAASDLRVAALVQVSLLPILGAGLCLLATRKKSAPAHD